MKRCAKCITPDSVPGIAFDENGICEPCKTHKVVQPPPGSELLNLIDSVRGQGQRYDVVVPLSGGRDSSYVLHFAKKQLGLRTLAVNFDNEFQTPQAARNIEHACRALNVDLEKVRSKRHLARRLVRASIRSSMPLGLYGVIGKLCRACAFQSAVYRTAEHYHVPLILWGASKSEATADVQEIAFSERQASPYTKLLRTSFYYAEWLAFAQRRELRVAGNSPFSRHNPKLMNPGIREVYLFDHVKWDRETIKATIVRELGWEKSPDHSSTWRIDCELHPFINYSFVKMLGCSKQGLGYSGMIREGQMTREEALAHEEEILATFDQGIRELLVKKIGLSPKEASRIMAFR